MALFSASLVLASCTGTLFEDISLAVQNFKAAASFRITDSEPHGANVPVNTAIIVTFSNQVESASAAGNILLEVANTNTPVAGGITVISDTVTFTPSSNLTGTTDYRVTVMKAITDEDGKGLSGNETWTFTTSNASAPVGSISIDANTLYTTDSDVALDFSATDDTTPPGSIQMRYSNSSTFDNSGWEAYSTNIPSWILLSGESTKTVYAWFKDSDGNVSNRVSDSIIVDTQAPINGTFVINSDATVTNSTSATLTLFAEDLTSGMDKMRISNTSVFADNNWVNYATSSPWTLTPGSGSKTVYMWFKDNAGNRISSPVNDTILLDTDAPAISARSPLSGATNVPITTTVSVTFNENINQTTITGSSVYVTDSDNNQPSFALTKNATGALLTFYEKLRFSILYTVHVTTAVKDIAGNPFAGTTWTFTTKAPALTLLGSFTADTGDEITEIEVANNVAYLGVVGTPGPTPLYGYVYMVSVSNPAAMGKTHENDTTSSNDTRGIAVYGNRIYAAQDNAGLYQMDASNLNELTYGSASYTGSKLGINSTGNPFIIDASGRLIGFYASNLAISGVELPFGSFEEVGAIATYGSNSYVGDTFTDMANSIYIREVYTAGIGGGVYIDETLDISSYMTDDTDEITGLATHPNDLLLASIGPSTGVVIIYIGDDPIYYLESFNTLSNAVDISVAGNYAFVARDTTGVGLIEVNSGSDARVVSDSLGIGSGYTPKKLAAYTNGSGEIIILTTAKTTGAVVYLRAFRLD